MCLDPGEPVLELAPETTKGMHDRGRHILRHDDRLHARKARKRGVGDDYGDVASMVQVRNQNGAHDPRGSRNHRGGANANHRRGANANHRGVDDDRVGSSRADRPRRVNRRDQGASVRPGEGDGSRRRL